MTRSLSFLRSIFILSLIFTVTACGGGGSSSPPDTTPNSFSFTAGDPVDPGEENVESIEVIVQGIEEAVSISVSGGEYRIGDGEYTSTAGTVSNGQSVQVRVTASEEFSSDASVTLTIGGVSGTYTVTTVARDDTPVDFAPSAPTTGIAISTDVNFTEFTVAGLNDAVDISVDAGTFTINEGSAVTSGTVSNDDRVVVTLTSSANFSTTVSATLTIGALDGVFSVSTEPQDVAPDVFSFTSVVDETASAVVTSDEIIVTGINDATAISVTGGATYSIDDGDFTSAAGTVMNEQQVRVRLNASSASLAIADATLTLGTGDGSQSATFTVRSALTFASSVDQLPSTANVVSATTVAIAGFSRTQNIAVTNGEYSIDGGTTYQASGDIENGQNLQVRANASAATSRDVVATVTITDPEDGAEIVGTYTVTTIADTTAPTAAIIFPTLVSLTEGRTVRVRGTASDDISGIQSVTLTVTTGAGTVDTVIASAIDSGNLETWTAEVDLGEDTVNTITVSTLDVTGNPDTAAAVVNVTQQTAPVSFPNDLDNFENLGTGGISLDQTNNRLVLVDTAGIFTVNLDTGVRTELIDIAALPSFPTKVHVDAETGQIYISSVAGQELISASSDGTGIVVFSDQTDGIVRPYGLKKSSIDGLLYVTDDSGRVYTADTTSGVLTREIFFDENYTLSEPRGLAIVSANTVLVADQDEESVFSVDISIPDGTFTELLGAGDVSLPQDVEYDSDQSRAVFVDSGLDAVLSVPVAGGSMTTISDATTPNADNVLIDPSGLALDIENNLAYVPSTDTAGADAVVDVVVIDLLYGDRVVLSRSVVEK